MSEEEKISIIIPVYNVAPYIRECLGSVIAQTYRNLEIILVDDGSTDGSEKICDEYVKRDERVHVIHKQNGGLVSARKAGIQAATGSLIGYVDSDDYIEYDMYEKLYIAMKQHSADVVVCAHTENLKDRCIPKLNYVPPGVYRDSDLVEQVFSRMFYEPSISYWGVSPACWDKLYKKELIYDLQMQVDERIWDGEDHAFIYPAMLSAKCICIIPDLLYHYRIRTDSVASAYDGRAFERLSYLYNGLKNILEKSTYWDKIKDSFAMDMRWFMFKHIKTELGVPFLDEHLSMPAYLFPFEKTHQNSSIILYGAGIVGQTYYRQVSYSNFCKVYAWCDRMGDALKIIPYGAIDFPAKVMDKDAYDFIVIAVEREDIADEIKRELTTLGADPSRIIWRKPHVTLLKEV